MFSGTIIAYFLLFFLLAWKNFRLALGLFIVILPAYLIRFKAGPLPTTLLELSFGALFLVWAFKYARKDSEEIMKATQEHRFLFIAVALFFMASVVSIFASGRVVSALGQWRAYFLEPMVLFLMLIGRKKEIPSRDLVMALGVSTLSVSVFAIVQQFTGWGIAAAEWANPAARRVTSFFSSPNAVGLYLGPIIPLLLASALEARASSIKSSSKILNIKYYNIIIFLILSMAAILFTKSQGAWAAVGVGAALFAYLVGFKKTAVVVVLIGILIVFVIPQIRTAALFQDKAGQNRLRLWSYSWNYLTKSPKNFVFGTGIRQFFRKVQKPHYNPREMERLIYPHNIFLNFWTEIGLVGTLSFTAILGYLAYAANMVRKKNNLLGAALLASLTIVVIHGLVDVPYFKNDLAMMFWVFAAIVVVGYKKQLSLYTVN